MVRDPAVLEKVEPLMSEVARLPHVLAVLSTYSPASPRQVSSDPRTAFATIADSKGAAQLPHDIGKQVISAVDAVHVLMMWQAQNP